jgi:NTP pyrophosphatase (non-canonical NTP hydrolase)
MTEQEIYKKAIDKWGRDSQLGVAQEECAELIQAISKYFRHGDFKAIEKVIEEAVDAEIMINQIKVIFPYQEIWDKYRKMKLNRVEENLKGSVRT